MRVETAFGKSQDARRRIGDDGGEKLASFHGTERYEPVEERLVRRSIGIRAAQIVK